VHLEEILDRVIDYWTPELPIVPPAARIPVELGASALMVH
jgi:hypothetical protein